MLLKEHVAAAGTEMVGGHLLYLLMQCSTQAVDPCDNANKVLLTGHVAAAGTEMVDRNVLVQCPAQMMGDLDTI